MRHHRKKMRGGKQTAPYQQERKRQRRRRKGEGADDGQELVYVPMTLDMYERILPIVLFLANNHDLRLTKLVLSNLTPKEMRLLSDYINEIIFFQDEKKLGPELKEMMKKHRAFLAKVSQHKASNAQLVQQAGFLGALLSAAIPILGPVISKAVGKIF